MSVTEFNQQTLEYSGLTQTEIDVADLSDWLQTCVDDENLCTQAPFCVTYFYADDLEDEVLRVDWLTRLRTNPNSLRGFFTLGDGQADDNGEVTILEIPEAKRRLVERTETLPDGRPGRSYWLCEPDQTLGDLEAFVVRPVNSSTGAGFLVEICRDNQAWCFDVLARTEGVDPQIRVTSALTSIALNKCFAASEAN